MKFFNQINLAIGIIKATPKLIKILSQSACVPWILLIIPLVIESGTVAAGMLALIIGDGHNSHQN